MKNANKTPEGFVNVTTRHKDTVKLTTEYLDAWFAAVEDSNSPEIKALVANRLLGRYGLQTSKDVITFFHSPAGETIKKMLSEKLADMIACIEQSQQAMEDEQSRHNRRLAFLLLGLAHKKASHAHHLNDDNLQQLEAKRHHTITQPAATDYYDTIDSLHSQANAFDESIRALEHTLHDKTSELALVEQGLITIKQHELEMESRYHLLVNDLAHMLERLPIANQSSEHITQELKTIEQTINTNTDKIAQCIVDGKHEDARQLALKTNSLHLQTKALKDMLSVLNGEKKLYDEDGQTTDSFKSAAFVLRPDLKIVKDSYGTQHLIGVHQMLDDLSIEGKAEAQKKFTRLRPEISSVKHLVQHNHHLEKQFHNQRVIAAYARATSLKDEVSLMHNALAKAKATQASIMVEMSKSPPNMNKIAGMHASMPSPSGSSSRAKAPVCSLQTLQDSYKKMLNSPSRQNIQYFTTNLNQLYGQQSDDILKNLNKIKPGLPISPAMMRYLERSLPNLTLTTINRPQPGYPSKKDHQEVAYTSPNPFNTKPSPFKV